MEKRHSEILVREKFFRPPNSAPSLRHCQVQMCQSIRVVFFCTLLIVSFLISLSIHPSIVTVEPFIRTSLHPYHPSFQSIIEYMIHTPMHLCISFTYRYANSSVRLNLNLWFSHSLSSNYPPTQMLTQTHPLVRTHT